VGGFGKWSTGRKRKDARERSGKSRRAASRKKESRRFDRADVYTLMDYGVMEGNCWWSLSETYIGIDYIALILPRVIWIELPLLELIL
jgi:hypothetical protein